MIELAHDFVASQEEAVTFQAIWNFVRKQAPETQDAQIGRFYQLLTLDGRFVAVGGNKWSLKARYSFKELYDDARGVYREVEELETATVDEEEVFEDEEEVDDKDEDESDHEEEAA
jgi:DNA-directed RNA polymerase subunit delta